MVLISLVYSCESTEKFTIPFPLDGQAMWTALKALWLGPQNTFGLHYYLRCHS